MDRDLAANTMQVAIIFHNMIVEARRDGYESELYKLVEVAVDRGYFVNKNGENNEFKWNTQCNVLWGRAGPSGTRWATHVPQVDSRVKGPVLHHVRKLALINHIWEMLGTTIEHICLAYS